MKNRHPFIPPISLLFTLPYCGYFYNTNKRKIQNIMTIVHSKSLQKRPKSLVSSVSTEAQTETEYECRPFFVDLASMPPNQLDHLRETGLLHRDGSLDICLLVDKHVEYLEQTWKDPDSPLRMSFVTLDASRPWMLYWTLHACDIMGHSPTDEACHNIVTTLQSCWSPTKVTFTAAQVEEDPVLASKIPNDVQNKSVPYHEFEGGGFGGGPGQLAHAATNYGAILALCIIAENNHNSTASQAAVDLLTSIRFPLYVWMKSLQQPEDGAFIMHHDGERDVRATYCLFAVAKLLGILTPQLASPRAVDFVASCQTWEGGFGGEPGSEAHGGYAFCAVAALHLMNALNAVDVQSLTGWLARRQMSYEGGFNGRSNKLVDGCYSFWQGGAMAIVSMYHEIEKTADRPEDPWFAEKRAPLLFDEGMLQRYILLCGQDIHGGLRDKPSKRRDFYHSCYCLSGLSVSQSSKDEAETLSFGHDRRARVHATHPVYNIRIERAKAILEKFKSMPFY